MPHPVRTLAFGALALGALASCAADSTGTSTLPPMVPSTTAFATLPPVTAPPTTQPGETTTVAPGAPVDYVIQAGDYLYGIAKNHGVSAEDIVTLNGWEDGLDHALNPGETIKVPAPAAGGLATTAPPAATGAAPPGDTTTATTAPPSGGGPTTTTGAGESTTTSAPGVPEGGEEYTVKNGDTVYGIAKKFGITPQALVAANGWSDVNHVIYPGDTIVVPAPA